MRLDPEDWMQKETLASTDVRDMDKVFYAEQVSIPEELFCISSLPIL